MSARSTPTLQPTSAALNAIPNAIMSLPQLAKMASGKFGSHGQAKAAESLGQVFQLLAGNTLQALLSSEFVKGIGPGTVTNFINSADTILAQADAFNAQLGIVQQSTLETNILMLTDGSFVNMYRATAPESAPKSKAEEMASPSH